jgi:predicted nucleic acid-binding Zn finger protein
MACLVEIKCETCGKSSQEVMQPYGRYDRKCSSCYSVAVKHKRDYHLAGLKALSIEERLSKIEEWIYDYKPVHVPAPRF